MKETTKDTESRPAEKAKKAWHKPTMWVSDGAIQHEITSGITETPSWTTRWRRSTS